MLHAALHGLHAQQASSPELPVVWLGETNGIHLGVATTQKLEGGLYVFYAYLVVSNSSVQPLNVASPMHPRPALVATLRDAKLNAVHPQAGSESFGGDDPQKIRVGPSFKNLYRLTFLRAGESAYFGVAVTKVFQLRHAGTYSLKLRPRFFRWPVDDYLLQYELPAVELPIRVTGSMLPLSR